MHTPSLTALLVILAIVIVIFGTKKLRNMGGDLGAAIKNFKGAMKDGESELDKKDPPKPE
ncbi:MAG TPA: Sec-independent protein translocase subunit TatA [Verrucomicrobiae bacterium]|nr:Sec-independent protein translocase subunit TatA [Verrucomicrobiae bacterium]